MTEYIILTRSAHLLLGSLARGTYEALPWWRRLLERRSYRRDPVLWYSQWRHRGRSRPVEGS